MKMITLIILLVGMVALAALIGRADFIKLANNPYNLTEDEYTLFSVKKDLGNGKHNIISYPFQRFIEEDFEWKKVEDAKSLKHSLYYCNVTADLITAATCLDFNWTSIVLNITLKNEGYKNKDIKVYKKDKLKIKTELEKIKIKSKDDHIVVKIKDYSKGDEIHIGEESTTIKVQGNYSNQTIATITIWSFAQSTGLYNYPWWKLGNETANGYTYDVVMKFNISSIPESTLIDTAVLGGYLYDNNISSSENGYDVQLIHVNHTYVPMGQKKWGNTHVRWDTGPRQAVQNGLGNIIDTLSFTGDDSTGWYEWDIKDIIQVEVDNTDHNDTFAFILHTISPIGSPDYTEIIYFRNVRAPETTEWQYLNVTYFDTQCEQDILNGLVDCSDNCEVLSATNIEPGDLYLDGTGTFTVTSDLTLSDMYAEAGCDVYVNENANIYFNGG